MSDRTLNSNMTSFFRFVNKRAIYRLGIISLAHAPVHVTDFPVVNVPVHALSSARIWQHKLCATLSAHVNINYRLPIKHTIVFVLLDISESYSQISIFKIDYMAMPGKDQLRRTYNIGNLIMVNLI